MFSLWLLILSSLEVRAHEGCENPFMPQHTQIVSSGRNEDVLPKFREATELLMGKGGVLEKLGIPIPPHVMRFMQGRELDALAAFGRHPVSHWTDGAEIIRSIYGPQDGVILEFVAPTTPCKKVAYYRDTVSFEQNLSILFHVIGHHVFGENTKFIQDRQIDVVSESLELFEVLERYYLEFGHDEVSHWYQLLQSLSMQQDITRGSFDPIESLVWGKNPVRMTASILQDITANLSKDLAPWKVDLARRFERLNRFISGAIPTKVMNEGFATLLQELLPVHTPYSDLHHVLEYGELLKGVRYGGIDNPYRLGLEAWRRIRSRFNARSENHGLAQLELDRRFLKYAVDEVIKKLDSYDFLKLALDPQWVHDTRLALTAPASDYQEIGPPPPDLEVPEQRVIVSRDPTRVIEAVIREVADFRFMKPRPLRMDPYFEGNKIQLGFTDEVGLNIPLDRKSAIATLYVDALLYGRTVVLDTVGFSEWDKKKAPPFNWFIWGPWNPPPPPEKATVFPVRISVGPDARVQVLRGKKNEKGFAFDPELSKRYQGFLDIFIKSQDLENPEKEARFAPEHWALSGMASELGASLLEGVPGALLVATPSVPRAILEYQGLVNLRLARALELAISGKGNLFRGPKGVKVRALPTIPEFNFDRKALSKLIEQETKPEQSQGFVKVTLQKAGTTQSIFKPEDGFGLEPINGNEGDRHWGNGKPPESEGGEGDDDGDNDGNGRNPSDGPMAGEGSQDPSLVEVPFDMYAKALGELIKLPNLKPKAGETSEYEYQREGTVRSKDGVKDYGRMQKNAYVLGRNLLLLEKKFDDAQDPLKCMQKGLAHLRPSDYAVKSHERYPEPNTQAQVTFIGDFSGSMMNWFGLVKKMIYDIQALLKPKYQRIEFRFIQFDLEGHVFKTAEEFYRAELGGGTDYVRGFDTVMKVQEDFPEATWDRYALLFGDLMDINSPEAVRAAAKKTLDQSNFFGVVWTNDFGDMFDTGHAQALKSLAEEEAWASFVPLTDPNAYSADILRKLFKNDPPK